VGRWSGSNGISTLERGNEENPEKITMRFPYDIADFRKTTMPGWCDDGKFNSPLEIGA